MCAACMCACVPVGHKDFVTAGLAGSFRQAISKILMNPKAPMLQYYIKGSMTRGAAPEIS